MLRPANNNFNNNFNKNNFATKPNIKSNSVLTLNQAIYNKPIITTLNDVIQQYNPTNQTTLIKTQSKQEVHNNIQHSTSSEESTYSTELAESSKQSKSLSKSLSQSAPESLSESSSTSYIPSETKFYWEYGNTGLKIKEFKKKMSRNLSTMYYIDRLFNEYINSVLTNSYSKLFSTSADSKHSLKTGSIKAYKGKVSATLTHKKLTGTYNVLEAGFISLSEIKLTEKDLKQNSIPNLESILTHKDNIYHMTKIVKMFNLSNKMTVKSNLSNKNNSFDKITQNANLYLNNLVNHDKKNKILKSTQNSGFYIKMYNDHGKGFIIDAKTNIIYYIAANINFKAGNINLRYYAFDIKGGQIVKNS